ncbi:MAG: heme exporter protein CcmD [Proteobacteria bacterium]|nr:heme exporter protein CcmD [Pseudomonadota bacterium]
MEAVTMGSYGAYVWTCFALALAVLIYSDWSARVRHKRVYRDIEVRIKALEERE